METMTRLKAILYDHDGTLVDSEYCHFEMWAAILEPYGISLSKEEYIQHYAGIPTLANAVTMVGKYSLAINASTLIGAKDHATRAFLAQQAFPLSPGARESVNSFKDTQCKLAIVTGAGLDGVTKTIAANGFEDVFQTVVSGDDVDHSKPAPDCYRLALNRLSLQASDCLAIEDSENGVRAAIAASVPCIAISTAMSKHDKLSNAMHTFSDLEAASVWINQNYRI
jgi:HAD superfamily hydrolase (TIGR01509 family)